MTNEREAFEAFCRITGRHPDEVKSAIWKAACAWQLERDAQLSESFVAEPWCVSKEIADKIRSGA